MYSPKADVYTALSTISGVTVRQSSQNVANEVPSITFRVSDNALELDLSNEIVKQDILITVDVWAATSSAADTLLASVETKMRGLGYRLSFQMDVPDPSNICHINTRFTGVKA